MKRYNDTNNANKLTLTNRLRRKIAHWDFGRIAGWFIAIVLIGGVVAQTTLYQNFAPRLETSRSYLESYVEEMGPELEENYSARYAQGYRGGYSRHRIRRELAAQAAPVVRDSLEAGGILPLGGQDLTLVLVLAGAVRLTMLIGRVLLALWMLQATTRHGSSGVWALLTLAAPVPVGVAYLIYLATRKRCSDCGRILPRDADYCPECGHPGSGLCRNCGAKVPENARYCPGCGQSHTPAE